MKKSEIIEMIREEILNESDYSKYFEVKKDINGEFFLLYKYNGLKTLYLGDKNSVKKVIKQLTDVIK